MRSENGKSSVRISSHSSIIVNSVSGPFAWKLDRLTAGAGDKSSHLVWAARGRDVNDRPISHRSQKTLSEQPGQRGRRLVWVEGDVLRLGPRYGLEPLDNEES